MQSPKKSNPRSASAVSPEPPSCPECGSLYSQIVDQRIALKKIRNRRRCRHCGSEFFEVEGSR